MEKHLIGINFNYFCDIKPHTLYEKCDCLTNGEIIMFMLYLEKLVGKSSHKYDTLSVNTNNDLVYASSVW